MILALVDRMGMYFVPGEWKLHQPKMKPAAVRDLYHRVERDRRGICHGVFDEDVVDMQTDSWRKLANEQKQLWADMLDMRPVPKFGTF